MLWIEGVDGDKEVGVEFASFPLASEIPVVAVGVKSKAITALHAARASMQGAIIDDEGLAHFDRYSDRRDCADTLVLELETAEVVPDSVLGFGIPVASNPALRRVRSNPVVNIVESLRALGKHAVQ